MGKAAKAPVFGMSVPVLGAQGQVIGAIVGATNLGAPNFLENLMHSPYGKTGGYLLVAPQSRQIITATDKNRIMEVLPAPGINRFVDRNIAGYEGYSVLINALGEEQLASVKRIPVAGWYILLGTPTTEALAPLYDLQQRVIWLTLLLILLTGALTWWVLGRQLGPLVSTADAMTALADTNQVAQPLPATRQGEIGQLVQAYNRIRQTWMQREAALAKTAELLKYTGSLAKIGGWELDRQSMKLSWTAETYRIAGLPSSVQPRLEDFINIYAPEARPTITTVVQVAIDKGTPYDLELPIITATGRRRWIHTQGFAELQNGKTVRLFGTFQDITERRLAADELSHKTAFFEAIFKSIPDAVVSTNVNREVVAINPAFTSILGYHIDELAGRQTAHFYESQDEFDRQGRLRFNLTARERSLPYQVNYRKKDGTIFPGETLGTAIEASDGTVLGFLGVIRNITERLQGQAKLQLAANVFEHAREAITVTDAKGNIVDVNHAFTRITGYDRDEVIGQNPRMLKSGRQDPAFYAAMWAALTEQGHWSGEIWNRRKNGEVFAELLTISAVRDEQGLTQQFVALFSDITAIKAHQSQLEHIAHFDALTNLPNRVLLADRLQQAMAQVKRRGQQLAVIYLDLDGFKNINDRHSHDVGDQLLITLSDTMKNTLREGDTMARMGGDEFVAVLIDLENPASSLPLLARLLEAAATPVPVGELLLRCSASLGVTFYPQEHDIDADQLLRQADQAMYQAKVAGKNQYHVFDAKQDSNTRAHNESLERIRLALKQGEFTLHYQPKVNMRSGKVIGAEALIRWQHPEKGLLAPAAFLPTIENHPLAVAVGEWVIDAALSQIERWHGLGLDLPISVNVSAFQLQRGDFVERLEFILANHLRVTPNSLELEVLETSALADMAQVSQVIEDCARLGVMFALDDFGTGYSSLTYLKRLRVNVLKIDQSFVRDMLDDPDDLAILEGIIGLAAAFQRQVIAEGVETVAHGTALLHPGCELAQGYGIARPMPAEQLATWAATWKPDVAWLELPWRGGQWHPLAAN
ncbi:MAG: EAL domain-containing protein, partial [Rhodoferax sp.]|nr:EAL domain-containing protein [Rhodoferax sp.]